MRTIIVLMLLGLCAAGNAFAITVDGNLSDWGVAANPANYTVNYNNWTPSPGIASWIEDWTLPPSGYVGPEYGGQNFDVEAAYMASTNDTLYAAFVSGFDKAGQSGWNNAGWYSTGDLFFDLGNNGTWDFAIALSTHGQPGEFVEGHAYIPTSGGTWWTTPTDYALSKPAQLKTGFGFTELSGVGYAYTEGTNGEVPWASGNPAEYDRLDHNIVEVSLSGVGLHSAFNNTVPYGPFPVTMHYTESCGNDVFDLTANDVVLPEPGTCILALGAVLAGAYARRRRKSERDSSTDAA